MDNDMSIPDAAALYGVTPKTIRRWIKDGKVTAYKHVTDRGFEWRIHMGKDTHDTAGNDTLDSGKDTLDIPDTSHLTAPTATDEHSAEYRALLQSYEALQQRHIELAGQLGFVQAQLIAAHEQIRLLTTEKPSEEQKPEPALEPIRKQPWWKRLFS